ncbi:hypothetical protein BU16DRAFT_391565 [Lophium mytilinum]|uniref:Uncharacterized protein n=1 Tax=Lophium mytilinum TaxID=390894 RepID=A0A6A6QUW0_9PEZI|nr:hypothetical protein BU16DRAFT_391565 [Lophium mytilinum]
MASPSRNEDGSARTIREQLQFCKHQKWGFIIYRCTYSSNADWKLFIDRLNEKAQEGLEASGALDLAPTLDLTVFQDKSRYNGASKDDIRKDFKHWVKSDEAAAEQPPTGAGVANKNMFGQATRYTFPVYVDEEAMRSVIDPAPDKWPHSAYIILIDGDWELRDPETFDYEAMGFDLDEDCMDDGEEPIEGCRLEDVGWLKAMVLDLIPGKYAGLEQPGQWAFYYRRPPGMWTY